MTKIGDKMSTNDQKTSLSNPPPCGITISMDGCAVATVFDQFPSSTETDGTAAKETVEGAACAVKVETLGEEISSNLAFKFTVPKPLAANKSTESIANSEDPAVTFAVPKPSPPALEEPETRNNKMTDSLHPPATDKRKKPHENTELYSQPDWAETCPQELGYRLEVIKNGIPLTDDTVDLSKEAGLNHCIFGRQPRAAVGEEGGVGATFLHPSISRIHALVQFGRGPSTHLPGCNRPGWFIYDMKSTHGTFVNKRRVPPHRYLRLHVGHVIRLGGSTRLLILQGPPEDTEEETSQSWSELVEAHSKRKAEEAIAKRSKASNNEDDDGNVYPNVHVQTEACNWGMNDDDTTEEGGDAALLLANLGGGASCLSHESMYADEPKTTLKAYFDRQGIDPPPQYEFLEGRFGQKNCRLELALDAGTVFAEVPVMGRKKDVIAACALEACRILDRLGEFDSNKESAEAVRQARQKEYWEKNDYYSSDEDPFLDRTGQLEVRRKKRMRRLGAPDAPPLNDALPENPTPDGSLEMLAKLETLGKEIIAVEDEFNAAEKAVSATGENASEMDELEAYMEAIKRGAPGREARQALKRRIFELRQEESRILRRLGIRQSFKGEFCSSASSAAATAVRTAMEKQKEANLSTEPDVEQKQEDVETEIKHEEKRSESRLNSLKRQLRTPAKTPLEFKSSSDEEEQIVEEEKDKLKTVATNNQTSEIKLVQKESSAIQALPTVSPGTDNRPEFTALDSPEETPAAVPPSPLVKTQTEVVEPPASGSKIRRRTKLQKIPKAVEARFPEADVYDISDPNYALWVPPEDQKGDGMTELNKKYGY